MAYAGTPTGLAQQAGTSRPWKTALAVIAILAIGLALVIAVMFINSRAVAPATDRGFDQIEAQRGALPAAALKHAYVAQDSLRGLPPVTPFASEDKPAVGTSSAAFLNAAAAKARAMSGVPADNSLDATVRAAASKARPVRGRQELRHCREPPWHSADLEHVRRVAGRPVSRGSRPTEVIVSKTRTEDRTDVRSSFLFRSCGHKRRGRGCAHEMNGRARRTMAIHPMCRPAARLVASRQDLIPGSMEGNGGTSNGVRRNTDGSRPAGRRVTAVEDGARGDRRPGDRPRAGHRGHVHQQSRRRSGGRSRLRPDRGPAWRPAGRCDEARICRAGQPSRAAARDALRLEDKPAVVDNSYDAVEKARDAAIRNGAPLDATSVDRKYQEIQSRGAHGRLP